MENWRRMTASSIGGDDDHSMSSASQIMQSPIDQIFDPKEESTSTKAKRLRRSYSCKNCRHRKIKCDRVFPCQSCKIRGISSSCGPHTLYDKFEKSHSPSDNDTSRPVIRTVATAPGNIESSTSSAMENSRQFDMKLLHHRHRSASDHLPGAGECLDQLYRSRSVLNVQLNQIEQRIESARTVSAFNSSTKSPSFQRYHMARSELGSTISEDKFDALFEQVKALDQKVNHILRTLASSSAHTIHAPHHPHPKEGGGKVEQNFKAYHYNIEDIQLTQSVNQWLDLEGLPMIKGIDHETQAPHHSYTAPAALESFYPNETSHIFV